MSAWPQVLLYVGERRFDMQVGSPAGDLFRSIALAVDLQPEEVRNALIEHEADGSYHLIFEDQRLVAVKPGPKETEADRILRQRFAMVSDKLDEMRRIFKTGCEELQRDLADVRTRLDKNRDLLNGVRRAVAGLRPPERIVELPGDEPASTPPT
jgi:hypothetical protein